MLPFWEALARHRAAAALVDAASGTQLSYQDLAYKVKKIASSLNGSTRKLLFFPLANRIDDVVFYLGALKSRNVVALYDPRTDVEEKKQFLKSFAPELIIEEGEIDLGDDALLSDLRKRVANAEQCRSPRKLFSGLKLLLSTSGSSGLRKVVRLSKGNISRNASQIAEALNIGTEDRAITSLPLTYVFGLSIVHSHLHAGGCIIVGQFSVMDRGFWEAASEHQITSFSGVPWTYQLLSTLASNRRLPFPASLRSLCVAGGKLDAQTSGWLRSEFAQKKLYFMYGQTEASGRMTVLPPDMVHIKAGSAGLPVAGARITISDSGEVQYRGPNVMLGYASSAQDLALGDKLGGLLNTGDSGVLDEQGFLYLTGRVSRMTKLFGMRFDLDDVQDCFRDIAPVMVQGTEEGFVISFSENCGEDLQKRMLDLCARWHLPKAAWELRKVETLKRLPSGKLALG